MKITIKALRVNAGLTQQQAAQRLRVSRETIQKWESEKTSPRAEYLVAMCREYGCSLSDIQLPGEIAESKKSEGQK